MVSCLGNQPPSRLVSVTECLLPCTGRSVLPGMPPEVDRGRVVSILAIYWVYQSRQKQTALIHLYRVVTSCLSSCFTGSSPCAKNSFESRIGNDAVVLSTSMICSSRDGVTSSCATPARRLNHLKAIPTEECHSNRCPSSGWIGTSALPFPPRAPFVVKGVRCVLP